MKVTVIDADVSYPMTSGKRLRTMNLLLPLAARHEITYLARCQDASEAGPAEIFLRDQGLTPILVSEKLVPMTGFGLIRSVATSLATQRPVSVLRHDTAAMRAAVRAHALRRRTDVWQVEFLGLLPACAHVAEPIVLQAHNVEALIWQRHCETERRRVHKAFLRTQWRGYVAAEAAAFRQATTTVAVSEADAELARRLYGDVQLAVVDNGVDVARFASVRPNYTSRRILFLGALDWRPNHDAVEVLLNDVFPRVRQRDAAVTLEIVGRKPPAALAGRIAATPGVTLHADVTDVMPYLARAAVMAVPLRIGGGSRLKILEAMAAGLPVVSTTVGAEGLRLDPTRDLDIADDWDAFADVLVARLGEHGFGEERGRHGRAVVNDRFDWRHLALRLEAVWEAARVSRP
jgi:glycosyltransferase involved in cell wall biosynthesis